MSACECCGAGSGTGEPGPLGRLCRICQQDVARLGASAWNAHNQREIESRANVATSSSPKQIGGAS